MAISKIILNGVTQMDVTDTTATADKILTSYGAYGADGLWMDGTASGGGGGLVYETGTFEPVEDIAKPTINFSNVHSEAPAFISISDVSETATITNYSNLSWFFVDIYKLFGEGLPWTTTYRRYGYQGYVYQTTASTQGIYMLSVASSDPSDASSSYPRYWTTETCFKPNSNSDTRYWRAGRTYKWIAVWAPT